MKHLIEPKEQEEKLSKKSPEEKEEIKQAQSNFKRNGLKEWNDRNRPGNNKKYQLC